MKHIVAVIAILAPLGGIEALVVITPVIGLVLAIIQLVVLFIAKRLLLHLTSSVISTGVLYTCISTIRWYRRLEVIRQAVLCCFMHLTALYRHQ